MCVSAFSCLRKHFILKLKRDSLEHLVKNSLLKFIPNCLLLNIKDGRRKYCYSSSRSCISLLFFLCQQEKMCFHFCNFTITHPDVEFMLSWTTECSFSVGCTNAFCPLQNPYWTYVGHPWLVFCVLYLPHISHLVSISVLGFCFLTGFQQTPVNLFSLSSASSVSLSLK